MSLSRSLVGLCITLFVLACIRVPIVYGGSDLRLAKYISSEEITVMYSQAGYHPSGTKTAVVWSVDSSVKSGQFRIIDSSGDEVLRAELSFWGNYAWGGRNWIADFSEITEEGTYTLEVVLDNGSRGVARAFSIDSELYGILAQKASRWFYYQRCGYGKYEELPGITEPCHSDDAAFRDLSRTANQWGMEIGYKDVTGGWHDAGDYNKWVPYAWIGIYGLLEVWDDLRPNWDFLDSNLPDPLAEAWWEVEFLLKVQSDDGTLPFGVVGWHPDNKSRDNNPWNYWGRPQWETECIPETGDERLIQVEWQWEGMAKVRDHALTAAALARFANSVAEFNREIADKSSEAACRIIQNYDRIIMQGGDLHCKGALLAAYSYLSVLSDTDEYMGKIEELADFILKRERLWGRDQDLLWPWLEVIGILEYSRVFPENAHKSEIQEKLVKLLDRIVEFTEHGPFAQMAEYHWSSRAKDANQFPSFWQGYNAYYLGTAFVLSRGAEILQESNVRKYLQAAEKQVQWILGRNPLQVCMMVGVGHTLPEIYHTRYVTVPELAHGRIPGGVVAGMLRVSDVTDLASASGEQGKLKEYPSKYPIMAITGRIGDNAWWRTNEYWVPVNGWFLLATSQLQRSISSESNMPFDGGIDIEAWSRQVLGVD